MRIFRAVATAGLVVLTLMPASVQAQNRSIFVVGGYGTTTFEANASNVYRNDFGASVSPVILYTMGRDVVFETELEFGMNGANTTTTLEYAQIDYLGFERVQLIAGKFLVPFGVFGERIHPSWINKLPTGPVVYGHAHGGVAETGLLPVLSDAGVMMRWAQPFSGKLRLDFSAYVTQGPQLGGEDDHDEEEGAGLEDPMPFSALEDGPAPAVAFGTGFGDNNNTKMVGARLGLLSGGSAGIYVSGFTGKYDEEDDLSFTAGGLSVEWRVAGLELRGEGVLTRQKFMDEVEATTETLNRSGFYLQGSKRLDRFEPVVRWGMLADGTVDGTTTIEGYNEVALGLNFWMRPTIPLKIAYEFHEGLDDRMYVQWAYGF